MNTESGLGNDPGEVPIQLPTDLTSDAVAASLQRILEDMGGVVESVQGNYMAATFRSPIFRFVDDFELRIDPASNLLHVRSASRVGTSDMGVNRKRVARFAARVSEL